MVVQFSAPRNIVTTMEYASGNASSSLLFQGSEDLCVRGWDPKSASSSLPALHITGYVYFPTSMAVHPDGKYLATGSKGFNSVGCEVKIWDLRNTSTPCVELKGHSHDVVGVKYSQGAGGAVRATRRGESSSSGAGGGNTHSDRGGLKLISASKDGSIFVWDATNER